MKTQINKLISGRKNIIRPMEIKGIVVGSSRAERDSIAEKVHNENPIELHIRLMGMEFFLLQGVSVSGKTITYRTDLSEEDYMSLMGLIEPPYTKAVGRYYLVVNHDMSVELWRSNRQRVTYRIWVAEEMVEIL